MSGGSSRRFVRCSAVSTERHTLIDLRSWDGRPHGAVPELQHADALGDFPRAVRWLRLHPPLLRRCSLQLKRSTRWRRRGRGDVRGASSRSCGELPTARVRRGRCGGSCRAYRAGSPCAVDEVNEPSWLRSVTNSRHGGRGGLAPNRMCLSVRRGPDTALGHEEPAGVSGLLRAHQILRHRVAACPPIARTQTCRPFSRWRLMARRPGSQPARWDDTALSDR
jgi:hypothetical protein